jgi:hypothetical protein
MIEAFTIIQTIKTSFELEWLFLLEAIRLLAKKENIFCEKLFLHFLDFLC